jgi:hypothetical protein
MKMKKLSRHKRPSASSRRPATAIVRYWRSARQNVWVHLLAACDDNATVKLLLVNSMEDVATSIGNTRAHASSTYEFTVEWLMDGWILVNSDALGISAAIRDPATADPNSEALRIAIDFDGDVLRKNHEDFLSSIIAMETWLMHDPFLRTNPALRSMLTLHSGNTVSVVDLSDAAIIECPDPVEVELIDQRGAACRNQLLKLDAADFFPTCMGDA